MFTPLQLITTNRIRFHVFRRKYFTPAALEGSQDLLPKFFDIFLIALGYNTPQGRELLGAGWRTVAGAITSHAAP